ncbi:MAG TPA: hypothetical protein VGV18_09305 [Verrucomicrobiae bacterium]|nr:hypothetical protein [Verrucomicrobiae bacterium]
MKTTPEQFNRALKEFQQFGPRRRIRIEDRWREILPDVSPDEFPNLKTQCATIEAFALNLAEQVRDKKLSDIMAKEQLARRFSILDRERLNHTWSQAMYFSIK